MPLERLFERDVDLLLAEELAVNPIFVDRPKSVTKFASVSAILTEFLGLEERQPWGAGPSYDLSARRGKSLCTAHSGQD
ncbi:hypothetical protein BRAO375_740028 [Bradyrhizobium sp. ORS 375]|nr:hypothetical protein BRAO375_740028 [Bradyrhizobium sp. ORS 375]